MPLTLEVSGRIAERLARLPEGEPRNREAVEWLKQVADAKARIEEVDNEPLTEQEIQMLKDGVADIDTGRYRRLAESLANFRARCEQERDE